MRFVYYSILWCLWCGGQVTIAQNSAKTPPQSFGWDTNGDTLITPIAEKSDYATVLIRDKFKKPIEYGCYYKGKRDGNWAVLYPSDSTLQSLSTYKEDKKDGISLIFGESGGIETEENYRNGWLHGLRRVFVSNTRQKQLEEHYEQGILDGKWERWYTSGKVAERCSYVKGKKSGEAVWYYESGQILTVYHYQNGQIEGSVLSYYENGQIKSETNFVHNEMEGIAKFYYPNHQIKIESKYKSGKKEGIWTYYTEEGKISKTEKYKNDQLIEEKTKIKP
ncbi:MAG TPA: toxin-antitoxin system YwqK family antitoxin [Chitinophagales bacterium]|nr:toxin-antitoxin system YwqK family antitoxin [Chitinophagales bacterium]